MIRDLAAAVNRQPHENCPRCLAGTGEGCLYLPQVRSHSPPLIDARRRDAEVRERAFGDERDHAIGEALADEPGDVLDRDPLALGQRRFFLAFQTKS